MDDAHLDGAGLEKALGEHRFDRPVAQLVGMVKQSDQPGHISFTPSGCEAWVDVPSAMIAEAEHIGQQPCKDHSHPVFRLSLKEPADAEGKVLMALLAASAPKSSSLSGMNIPGMAMPGMGMPAMAPPTMASAARAGPGVGGSSAMRAGGCHSFCSGSTLWCMCPVYIPGLGTAYTLYPCGTCINDPVYTAFASPYYPQL